MGDQCPDLQGDLSKWCSDCSRWGVGSWVRWSLISQTLNNVGCVNEPNGTQHIQVNGQWIYVEWHGDQLDAPEHCDGCGDAYAQGASVGQVCADFSSWLAWEVSPI